MTFEEIIYTEKGRLPYKSNRDKYKYYKDTLQIAYSCEEEVLRESAKYMCKYIEEHYPHILQKYLDWIKPKMVSIIDKHFNRNDKIGSHGLAKVRHETIEQNILCPIIFKNGTRVWRANSMKVFGFVFEYTNPKTYYIYKQIN
jgi:hypothetical protein